MGSVSVINLLIVLVVLLVWVIPLAKLLSRLGFNQAWALLSFIPIAGVVLLWVIAFVQWPIADAKERRS